MLQAPKKASQARPMPWEDVVKIFLKGAVVDSVSEQDGNILITTSTEEKAMEIQRELQRVLGSQAGFESVLPIAVRSRMGGRETKVEVYDDFPAVPEGFEAARIFFKSFVGEAFFQEAGFNIDFLFGADGVVEDGILYSAPAKFEYVIGIWDALAKALTGLFRRVTPQDLDSAWRSEKINLHSLASGGDAASDNQLNVLDDCAGLCHGLKSEQQQAGTKQQRLFIDLARIYEQLVPPPIELSRQGDAFVLTLSRQHFIRRLFLLSGGLFFQQTEVDSQPMLSPLTVGVRSSNEKPLRLTIAIDTSGSMEHALPKIKEILKGFLRELARTRSHGQDVVRLVIFDSTNQSSEREFYLTTVENERGWIDSIKHGGATPLYKTVNTEVQGVMSHIGDYNNTLVILTDGADNDSGDVTLEVLAASCQALADKDQTKRCKVLAYGLSDQADMALLRKLTQLLGMPDDAVAINEADGFADLLQHLEEIGVERRVMNFLIGLKDEVSQQMPLVMPAGDRVYRYEPAASIPLALVPPTALVAQQQLEKEQKQQPPVASQSVVTALPSPVAAAPHSVHFRTVPSPRAGDSALAPQPGRDDAGTPEVTRDEAADEHGTASHWSTCRQS